LRKEVTENFQFTNGGSKRKCLIHITGKVLGQNILYSDQAMAGCPRAYGLIHSMGKRFISSPKHPNWICCSFLRAEMTGP
jgi:hypothetical protein